MILWRLLPLARRGGAVQPGWSAVVPARAAGDRTPRQPDRYGCLYLSESPTSAVAEALAQFRGVGVLSPGMLIRANLPLALAQVDRAGDQSS